MAAVGSSDARGSGVTVRCYPDTGQGPRPDIKGSFRAVIGTQQLQLRVEGTDSIIFLERLSRVNSAKNRCGAHSHVYPPRAQRDPTGLGWVLGVSNAGVT